jgi:DNA-binding PadR family transcriptional regulator
MTNKELAILSLIVETPRHGYEIEQIIEERGMREWTEIGFSSIYYILRKLEQAGWVESRLETDAGRGPARKVYHTTPEGMRAWHDATLEVLSCPAPSSMPFLLGLSNLPGIAPDETLTAVVQYRAHLAERRDHLRTRVQEQAPLPHFVDAMFDLSLTLIEAELAWVTRFADRLERREREQGLPNAEAQPT